MSNLSGNYEKWITLLSLLNVAFLNSYYFYDKYMEEQTLSEVTQLMLYDNSNTMQYEIEDLILGFCSNNTAVIFTMLDQFHKLINVNYEASKNAERVLLLQKPSTDPINPYILEYLASCLRYSTKSLYSIVRLTYIFLKIVTIKQKDAYMDIFEEREFTLMEQEIIPRLEIICTSAYLTHWTINQPVNNPSSNLLLQSPIEIKGLIMNSSYLSISSLAILESLNSVAEFCESEENKGESCGGLARYLMAQYCLYIPLEENTKMPNLFHLLALSVISLGNIVNREKLKFWGKL